MKDYLNMPDQTASTIRDGWLYTGDAGYLSDDNYLYVVDLPREKWGEMVHAEVVIKPGQPVNEQTLIEHCREFIAGYKIPKSIPC